VYIGGAQKLERLFGAGGKGRDVDPAHCEMHRRRHDQSHHQRLRPGRAAKGGRHADEHQVPQHQPEQLRDIAGRRAERVAHDRGAALVAGDGKDLREPGEEPGRKDRRKGRHHDHQRQVKPGLPRPHRTEQARPGAGGQHEDHEHGDSGEVADDDRSAAERGQVERRRRPEGQERKKHPGPAARAEDQEQDDRDKGDRGTGNELQGGPFSTPAPTCRKRTSL
jgi:hypothetical protein